MSRSFILPSSPRTPYGGRLFLTAAFFTFCYVLLTWRAHLLNDAAPYLSDRRAIALLAGAGVFWVALGQLERQGRLTLVRVASWIVLGSIVVLLARMAVNWWKPDIVLTPAYSVRWALAWAAYFGLWLMGAAAFRYAPQTTSSDISLVCASPGQHPGTEQIDWLVDALLPELEGASCAERARVADGLIRQAGTYERADILEEATVSNARLRVAYRVAQRIRGDD